MVEQKSYMQMKYAQEIQALKLQTARSNEAAYESNEQIEEVAARHAEALISVHSEYTTELAVEAEQRRAVEKVLEEARQRHEAEVASVAADAKAAVAKVRELELQVAATAAEKAAVERASAVAAEDVGRLSEELAALRAGDTDAVAAAKAKDALIAKVRQEAEAERMALAALRQQAGLELAEAQSQLAEELESVKAAHRVQLTQLGEAKAKIEQEQLVGQAEQLAAVRAEQDARAAAEAELRSKLANMEGRLSATQGVLDRFLDPPASQRVPTSVASGPLSQGPALPSPSR